MIPERWVASHLQKLLNLRHLCCLLGKVILPCVFLLQIFLCLFTVLSCHFKPFATSILGDCRNALTTPATIVRYFMHCCHSYVKSILFSAWLAGHDRSLVLFFFQIFPSRQGNYLTCDIEETPYPPKRERSINPSTDDGGNIASGWPNQGLQSVNLCVTHSLDDVPGGICGHGKWRSFRKMKNRGIVMDIIVTFKDMSYMSC